MVTIVPMKYIRLLLVALFWVSFNGYAGNYNDALFNKKLAIIRELMARPSVKEILREILKDELTIDPELSEKFKIPKSKDISETQMLLLLDQNPQFIDEIELYIKQVPRDQSLDTEKMKALREKWSQWLISKLSDEKLRAKFRKQNNPLEAFEVSDIDGYSDVQTYVNHARKINGKIIPADNLKNVFIDQIKLAQKEIAINVFDFDLEDVADELIKAHQKGIAVKIGIDKSVINARVEVQKIFTKLKQSGIFVHAVDSVGLNHQKMMSIDWTIPGEGKVVFSSGNLTQSCIGPEGDLKNIPPEMRPKYSIPNANNMITLKSDILSSIVAHEISKTIDPEFQFRGEQYPLGGVYKVWSGPTNLGDKRPYIMLAFSPNGALDGINKNFISQAIERTSGEVKMAQFAFSSKTIDEALLKRASLETKANGKFDFKSVGDTPFAMQFWSIFLKMSGLERIPNEDKTPAPYTVIQDSEWKNILGESEFLRLREMIKIAPSIFGKHSVEYQGARYDATSKIHHKFLITGNDESKVVVTGSFNFSTGAESNQEYILLTNDDRITTSLEAAFDSLHASSRKAVYQEAERRNKYHDFEDDTDSNVEKEKMVQINKTRPNCNHLFIP